MHNINQLNAGNCVLALIDHQPRVAFPIHSITVEYYMANVPRSADMEAGE